MIILTEAEANVLRTLLSEVETVCDLWGGDKSVDALRAALSAFLDLLKDGE